MKKRIFLVVVAALALFALAAIYGGRVTAQHSGHDHGAQKPAEAASPRKVLYWYDPMHPAYKADKPGIAPDCGMKLVPMYADEAEAMQKMPPGTVMLSPEKQQLIGVRTAAARREHLVRTLRTVGRVTADETRIAKVHLKVGGWIEKVYVDFVGQEVTKGQPLFTLYSPDLVSTEQEYLVASRGMKEMGDSSLPGVAAGARSLLRATRERLRLWDISDEQVHKLEESGEVARTLTFYSPISGFVLERKAYPQAAISPETDLYTVADLSDVWVNAEIYEYEVPYVGVGQPASMQLSYLPGRTYRGRVTYVYPTVDPESRTVKVRLQFPNRGYELKPDMLANVEVRIDYGVHTLVPSEAVLDSGTRQIVFVAKPEGYFEPREVKLGPQVDGQAVVLSGLEAGETIVTSGNFLIDSESRLGSAMGGMSHKH